MKFEFESIRQRLAYMDALPLLSVLGILSGLLSGAVILLFRLLVEAVLGLGLNGSAEDFEQLPAAAYFLLPALGALVLGFWFHFAPIELRRNGVGYVVERFNLHQGVIGWRSLLTQFFAGAISLMSGHPMGREGPAVHLGAAASSLLGQWAGLPNNSLRILVGCGCAAAISASFNTPLAGVVFAMEVVMLEYSITTFTPIILASVAGAGLTRAFYGHAPAFQVPDTTLNSLFELPFLILTGLLIGCLAAAFVFLTKQIALKTRQVKVWQRFAAAGVLTGGLGFLSPQILGIGYDTVNSAMIGEIGVVMLIAITALKLIASSICAGVGLPGGIIGPSIVIGATAGGVLGQLGSTFLPGVGANAGFYVVLGMAAMMSATLQAPLAALIALLELTSNAHIIFPGMLVVVIANLIASELFRQKGFFQTLLSVQGIELKMSAFSRHLNRVAVPAVMERNFKRVSQKLTLEDAKKTIEESPVWLLVDIDGAPKHILPAADLANYFESEAYKGLQEPPLEINLLEIPAGRENIASVLMSATLKEALDAMDASQANAVYVKRMNAPNIYRIFGVVTRMDVERFYKR